MTIMIIVIIIIDTFILGGNNNGDADDPHLSKAVISIFVQNSMPPFVEFGHKILSQLNFGINVVDKWCLVSITCVAVSLMGFSLNQRAVLICSLSWARHFFSGQQLWKYNAEERKRQKSKQFQLMQERNLQDLP